MSQFSGISPSVAAPPANQLPPPSAGVMPAGYYGMPTPQHALSQTHPDRSRHYAPHTGPRQAPVQEYAPYHLSQLCPEQHYGSDSFMEKYAMIGLYDHLQRGGRESYRSAVDEARKLIKEERLDTQYRGRGYSRRGCRQNRGREEPDTDNKRSDRAHTQARGDKRDAPRSTPGSREASPVRGRQRNAPRDANRNEPGQFSVCSNTSLTAEDTAAFEQVVKAIVDGLADLATDAFDEPMAGPSNSDSH
ncbi:hypothetical protein JB92DRAFT_3134396 [Gautieria morchelliformis]|nr:hypothetical protein JB92DRAFT_3134396 [Gautieria morchelliformis]